MVKNEVRFGQIYSDLVRRDLGPMRGKVVRRGAGKAPASWTHSTRWREAGSEGVGLLDGWFEDLGGDLGS